MMWDTISILFPLTLPISHRMATVCQGHCLSCGHGTSQIRDGRTKAQKQQFVQDHTAQAGHQATCPAISDGSLSPPGFKAPVFIVTRKAPQCPLTSCLPRLISYILHIFKVVLIFIIFIVARGTHTGHFPLIRDKESFDSAFQPG